MDENNVKVSNKVGVSIDWYVPWVVGCMFTCGYVVAMMRPETSEQISMLPIWAQFGLGVLTFLGWPAILGIALGGGF